MTLGQRQLETRLLKASKKRNKKRIEKIVRYCWKKMLKVLTGESSTGYKNKK